MSNYQTQWYRTLEMTDRPQRFLVDFNNIQVAPQRTYEFDDFQSLSLAERQELLQRLIERVKKL